MGWGSVSSASCTSQFVRRVIRCQVCAVQLLTRNCSPGLWAQRALDCASALRWPPFLIVVPLSAVLQARIRLWGEIPLRIGRS